MKTPKQELLNYAQFLKESGFLYAEAAAPVSEAENRKPEPAVSAEELPMKKSSDSVQAPARRKAAAPEVAAQELWSAPPPIQPTAPKASSNSGLSLAREERMARVAEAKARVAACTACPLCKGRNNSVYSDGDIMAKIMFVGEAPGEEEDRQGLPFVGRSGQLLTKMIQAIGFKREEVYICNTVKCRPPSNRDPLPQEKDKCEPFLVEQLDLIRPQILVALGSHAAQYLCKSEESIGRLRGIWHSYHGVPLRATYHPAFLLRSPGMKGKAWEDFQEIHKKYCALNPDDCREIWQKG